MSDENVLSQNATEEKTVEPEKTTGESQTDSENKNPEIPSQPEKKQKDFEKATYKFRNLFKEKSKEVEELKKQMQTSTAPDREALKELIEEALAPIKQVIEKQTESQILDEIAQMPYSNELAEHIKSEYDKLPASMDLRTRMMTARSSAIANNLDVIIQANREVAKEEAYGNQGLKSTKTLGERPTNQGQSKSLLERLQSGELSSQEYMENRDEIMKLHREGLGL